MADTPDIMSSLVAGHLQFYCDHCGEPATELRPGGTSRDGVELLSMSCDAHGERAQIVKWLREEGPLNIGRPHVSSPTEKCPHDSYRWDDCAECTLLDMASLIEAGEHQ